MPTIRRFPDTSLRTPSSYTSHDTPPPFPIVSHIFHPYGPSTPSLTSSIVDRDTSIPPSPPATPPLLPLSASSPAPDSPLFHPRALPPVPAHVPLPPLPPPAEESDEAQLICLPLKRDSLPDWVEAYLHPGAASHPVPEVGALSDVLQLKALEEAVEEAVSEEEGYVVDAFDRFPVSPLSTTVLGEGNGLGVDQAANEAEARGADKERLEVDADADQPSRSPLSQPPVPARITALDSPDAGSRPATPERPLPPPTRALPPLNNNELETHTLSSPLSNAPSSPSSTPIPDLDPTGLPLACSNETVQEIGLFPGEAMETQRAIAALMALLW